MSISTLLLAGRFGLPFAKRSQSVRVHSRSRRSVGPGM